ncbi:DUF896 domain-containing protein [Paludicola sp. MB14-C6]|uniref:DUF896 domain-containing protein n=1 Tax=Paludihabitans sp. MB14-C6 TaxID=3070656 RepID=UPI0027DD5853|nr:DUF896 domain-containing protein [Paludicola sp. MB14-C6]WMJ23595.1 DUF896 domain-containing protein [Paludicola sp. MB14-C6]
MEQAKLDRINELARKSKETQLTEQEILEQQLLRAEYIKAYRDSLRSSLDQIVLVDEKGKKTKLSPKNK